MAHASATAKILLVDDEPRNLLALEAVLQGEGRHLVHATSGQEALKYILQEDFAVIVLDVLMPGMDGFELASLIRGRERSRDTPILFVTAARKEEPHVVKGYALGAADYILKPFDPDSLRAKVGVFVDLFRKSEEVRRQADELAETTSFLNSILASTSNIAIAALDLDGVFQMWPEGARRLYGYEPEEMVGRRRLASLHAEEEVASGRLARFLERALQEGKAEETFQHVRKDGVRFSASEVMVRRTNGQGVAVGFVAITQDITERLRAEEARVQLAGEQAARAEAEAGRRRAAVLAEASRAFAEAGPDVQGVLDAVAHLVVEVVGDACAIYLVAPNGATLEPVAMYDQDPTAFALLKELMAARPWGVGEGMAGRAVQTGQAVLMPEVDPGVYRALLKPERQEGFKRNGVHSVLSVPLRAQGRPVGALSLARRRTGQPYTEDDVALAQDLADRAAVVLERARLYHAEWAARAGVEALAADLAKERGLLDTLLSQAPVGFAFLDRHLRYVRINERMAGSIGLPAEVCLGRTPAEVLPADRARAGEARLRRVLETGEPLLDVAAITQTPAAPGRVRHWQVDYYPVRGPDGAILGVGAVADETTGQVRAEAERARLLRALAARERQLQELVGRLILAQEEERRHVAYEVHDGVAQVVAGAHLHLRAFARRYRPRRHEARAELDRAVELAQRAVREARTVVGALRPTVLDDLGLEAALEAEVEELRKDGWRVDLEAALGPDRLELVVETALFRVAQEALRNARKHAGADRARVVVRRSRQGVRLEVRDWGRGFRPEAAQQGAGPGERVGLSGMKERVALLGGRCEVRSRPGAGTRVIAVVPLPASGEAHAREPAPVTPAHAGAAPQHGGPAEAVHNSPTNG